MFRLLLLLSIFLNAKEYLFTLKSIGFLKPKDSFTKVDNSQNVLQGIVSYKNRWIVSQAVGKKRLLFNLLDSDGLSIANRQLNYASHGQDLSIEEINSTSLYLYTVGQKNRGIVRFKMSISSKDKHKKLNIEKEREFLSKIKNTTVTLSEDKQYLLTYNKGIIKIYKKEELIKGVVRVISKFPILNEQKKIWFQGIVMYGDTIFTLSGKNTVFDKKILAIYTKKGLLLDKYYIEAKDITPRVYTSNDQWELEGLTFRDQKIYTTINSFVDGKYSKELLEILTLKKRDNR
jgi:hypothetical protein